MVKLIVFWRLGLTKHTVCHQERQTGKPGGAGGAASKTRRLPGALAGLAVWPPWPWACPGTRSRAIPRATAHLAAGELPGVVGLGHADSRAQKRTNPMLFGFGWEIAAYLPRICYVSRSNRSFNNIWFFYFLFVYFFNNVQTTLILQWTVWW